MLSIYRIAINLILILTPIIFIIRLLKKKEDPKRFKEKLCFFSKERGNDLKTPRPLAQFPGLRPGDKWCLCAARWIEAHKNGAAPQVVLESTHEETLVMVSLEVLEKYKP